jgi:hypothetical protein
MAILNTPPKPFLQKYRLLAINLNKVPEEVEVVDVTFPADSIAITVIILDKQET